MIDYATAIQTYYREEIAAQSGPEDTADRQECIKLAADRISEGIDDGDIEAPEIGEQIRRDLTKQDESDKAASDRMIDLLVFGGQEDLDFEDLLDVVVTLGSGRRKPWRYINEFDLEEMDAIRYGNLEKQQAAYSQWRPKFLALRGAWRRHGNVAAVYASGPVGTGDDVTGEDFA